MKPILPLLLFLLIHANSYGQFVAKMQVKEDIPGVCDKNEVYALFPSMEGQDEAICPLTDDELLEKLNTEIQFLKDNPKHKDKGMLSILINCEGKIVQCKLDGNGTTKSKELDQQIVDVFESTGPWEPGKLNGKNVDSNQLITFKIKKGAFIWD